jgi:hypothetical protein
MEAIVKAKKIGGSIAVLIPKKVVDKERIFPEDTLKIKVEKTADFNWLWGRFKGIKKSTDQIMKEIDEAELDD